MTVRTCLLVSDDPDDHIEFSEALYEISDDTVLVSVADPKRAVDLLSLKKYVPEFIFLNLAAGNFTAEVLFTTLDDPEFKHVRVVGYGDAADAGNYRHRIYALLDGDFSYSELKGFLQKVVGG